MKTLDKYKKLLQDGGTVRQFLELAESEPDEYHVLTIIAYDAMFEAGCNIPLSDLLSEKVLDTKVTGCTYDELYCDLRIDCYGD